MTFRTLHNHDIFIPYRGVFSNGNLNSWLRDSKWTFNVCSSHIFDTGTWFGLPV